MSNKKYKRISDKEYSKILDEMPICCVDLVLKTKKGILLVLRKQEPAKNNWWFPGGRVFKNEKLKDAAVRKAYEETGIKVKVEKILGVYETMFDKSELGNAKGVHTINVCFLIKPENEDLDIKLDNTSSSYRWINKIEEDLNDYTKNILREHNIL